MLISFAMPVYKKEEYLRDAIDSVLMQTHKDIELIIVDDATPKKHGIEEIVRYFTNQDKRVKYYKNKYNMGVANTRNVCNKMAKGKIICVQDADDLSYPQRAEIVNNYFKKHPKVDIMYGSCELVTDMGKLITRRLAEDFNISRMKLANYINHLTVAYRRDIGVKYRKDLRYIDDWYFYMDCFMAGKAFGYVHEIIAVYRIVGDGLTYGCKSRTKQKARNALNKEFGNLEVDISKSIQKSGIQRIRLKRILELVPYRSKVLEMGCNTGAVIQKLKTEKKCKVEGVEIAQNLIDIARKKGLKIIEGDITKYSNGSRYDRVLLCDVIEHFMPDEAGKIIDNSLKMLKKKGKLIITVPYEHGGYSKQYVKAHVFDYSAESIKKLFPNRKVESKPIITGSIAIPAWLIMTVQ